MSEISNEIDRIISDVNTAHEAVLAKGGTTAQPYTARSLASAINTIPVSSSGGAAPVNHASADATYGMATEEMYGHARAYASAYYPAGDEEGIQLVAPDGSEFEFGVPSGYFLDMAFFQAANVIYSLMFQDLQFQIDELTGR